jgi:glycosyltransferase involved in cell wall biosynthesis
VRGRWTAAVAIPCFNEARRLDPSALLRFAAAHPDFRFVLVDDASDDGTADLLAQLHDSDPERFEPLRLARNAGQGGAVRAGVLRALACDCTYFGYWDADLAAPLSELPRFVEALDDDPRCLAVYGARVRLLGHRIARPPHRYYLGRLFADAAARALGIGVYDPQCGAKLFRSVPETWALFQPPFRTRWFHDLEILARLIRTRGGPDALGGLVRELPLHSWCDVPGSKVRLRDFLLAPFQLARIHFELRAALAPGRAPERSPARVGNDRALPP